MIAEKESTAVIGGNATGDIAQMGIHPDATAHVMGILSKDLYSDPLAAVVREYATNAWDAHVEAGVTRPIEVTLPTRLRQTLVIRDYGVGLSVDDIHEIYSQYGASTKRSTNNQAGMLGLGCKAAFAYVDQFTVRSIKNGVAITVLVTRDDTGAGKMMTVDTSSTDEAQGTTIQIPTRAGDTFADEAAAIFKYWEPGAVLVNGAAPEAVTGLPVGDNIILRKADGYWDREPNVVVMGQVAYPMDDSHTRGFDLPYGCSIVARVPIGSVNFQASREALRYTDKTEATIRGIHREFRQKISAAIQQEIDRAPTPSAALTLAVTWRSDLNIPPGPLTYQGATIPDKFKPTTPRGFGYFTRSSRRLKDCDWAQDSIPAGYVPDSVWVENFDRAEWTATMRKKLNQHVANKDLSPSVCVIARGGAPAHWLRPEQIVQWKDVAAEKLPRAAVKSNGKVAASYDCYVWDDDTASYTSLVADDIDRDEPIFWASNSVSYRVNYIGALLARKHDNFTIVTLADNRKAKFHRLFPEAESVFGCARDQAKAFSGSLTAHQRKAMAVQQLTSASSLRKMDAAQINDPVLSEYVQLAQQDLTSIQKMATLFSNAGIELSLNLPDVDYKPLSRYPLLQRDVYGRSYDHPHTYIYINAVYAAEQEDQ